MPAPNAHLRVFVATRAADVPPGCRRYISVDGAVPGAEVVWDHHATGEPVNLDAMPARFDASDFDGIGTTLADTDAAASVAVTLLGGWGEVSGAVLGQLRAGSHWCDHLRPDPALDPETNEVGRRFDAWVAHELGRGRSFSEVCAGLADAVARAEPLPQRSPEGADLPAERVQRFDRIAVFDERGLAPGPPAARYAQVDCRIGVFLRDHPQGGLQVVVGASPFASDAPSDLRPALAQLAALEFAAGPPARGADPVAGNETWGGRATAFGSPWNYGTRLTVAQIVAALVAA